MKPALANLKTKPFGGASYIQDQNLLDALDSCAKELPGMLFDTQVSEQFCNRYVEWIQSTKNNSIQGLDQFPFAVQTNATTEAFDKFYIANHTRRFRCFRGEYMYHQVAWRNSWPDWQFLEDAPIDSNDAVVVSYPFSDTGTKHQCMDKILQRCSELDVPVLIDCAYFGICGNIEFNFSWPCITTITFGLSKTFPVSHARIGMRLTKIDDDDPAFVYQKTNYTNRISAGLGLFFMKSYGPDYVYNKYRSIQLEFCDSLNVTPSDCVMFGIGDSDWEEYNRGSDTNRLSFHKYLHTGKLPKN